MFNKVSVIPEIDILIDPRLKSRSGLVPVLQMLTCRVEMGTAVRGFVCPKIFTEIPET